MACLVHPVLLRRVVDLQFGSAGVDDGPVAEHSAVSLVGLVPHVIGHILLARSCLVLDELASEAESAIVAVSFLIGRTLLGDAAVLVGSVILGVVDMLLMGFVMKFFLELQLVIALHVLSHVLRHVDAPSVAALEVGVVECVVAMISQLGSGVLQARLDAGLDQRIGRRELSELHNI